MLDGVITVKDLLLQPYERQVGDIMDTHVIKAKTTDDQELVADTMNKYGLLSMPVVDRGPSGRDHHGRRCHGSHGGRGHRGLREDGGDASE